MPFSGFDLINRIASVRKAFEAEQESAGTQDLLGVRARRAGSARRRSRSTSRVSLGQLDQRTVLIDGSLQFGDLRALLKVPTDAPSILDLPTDRIAESDLGDVLWRDPSGIDILLAPPRIEMAEMVTPRDVEKVLSLLRRVYGAIVIDMSSYLNDVNLAFLDASDTIVEIVTYDSTTIHNTVAIADTFRAIGYPATKVRYLVNRADSAGRHRYAARWSGRSAASRSTGSCRTGGSSCSRTTRACRSCSPTPTRPSARTSRGWRPSCSGRSGRRQRRSARRPDVRSPADRGVRFGRRRDDRAAGDPAALSGRVDGLPRRQRPRSLRGPIGRGGPRVLDAVARCPRGARRQGARRRLQHVHGRRDR